MTGLGRYGWAALAALLACGSISRAYAQDAAALAARRGLIDQAEGARREGNHQQALELAQRAARIQMSPSLRLFLAQEQYALHQLAEAFGNADACMREAEADTQLRNREQVAATCRSLAQELRNQIGHVTIRPPSPPPSGLAITVNGNAVGDALWGVPYAVTPGHVTIVAHAPGYRDFQQSVDVAANGSSDVPVTLEPVQTSTANQQHQQASSSPPPAPPPSHGGPGVLPWVVAGVGVVAVVAGVVMFLVPRQSELNTAEMYCPNLDCSTTSDPAQNFMMAQPHRDAAANWTIAADITGAVGIVAIAGGVAWFFLARPSEHPATTGFNVTPTRDGAIVGYHGTF